MEEVRFRLDSLDLPSQFLDMAVNGAVADYAFIGVNPVHELLPPVDASRVAGKEVQQLELDCRELQIAVVQRCPVAGFVENKAPGLDCLPIARPAKDGLDPRNYFARAERLADVVVGPQFKSKQTIYLFDPCRHHDDRYAGEGPDVLADVHAVAPRQHQIKQHQVGFALPDPGHDLRAVCQVKGLEAGCPQIVGEHICEFRLILDNKNRFVHVNLLLTGRLILINKPPSGEACAEIIPSWASTMFLHMAKP